jgi:hypothetical protein
LRSISAQQFTGLIWPENEDQFGDLDSYDGKGVLVIGVVREYRGKPEMNLTEKS